MTATTETESGPATGSRTGAWRLTLIVLAGGACSLATEMSGARLLAPYFGTSNLVWANVIGLMLLYLAVGYWVGGKLADRYPTERALAYVVMGSAVTIACLPFISRPLFSAATGAFDGLSAGGFIASFFGTMLLFAVPVTALGTISPWAIRLSVHDVREAGSVSGRLYAISTIGSLIGTFLPVLIIIPWIGTQRTIIAIAAVLALAALPLLPIRFVVVPILIALATLIPPGSTKGATNGRVLFERESAYQYVQVIEKDNGDRILHLNEGWAIHSLLPRAGVLTHGYWDGFLALPALGGGTEGNVAVLGNAGGTISNMYARAWPEMTVDGVEIDPLVSEVGRRYLGMNSNPRLTVHTDDARVWLRRTPTRHSAMVIDAYRQPYIPFQLVSREFFTLVRDRLTPTGVVGINVGTPPGQTEAVAMIAATMRDVFPTVVEARYDAFNSLIFAFPDALSESEIRRRLRAAPGLAAASARVIDARLRVVDPGGTILTDDHAPIEWVTDRALLTYLGEGAPGAERN